MSFPTRRSLALAALCLSDPSEKCTATRALCAAKDVLIGSDTDIIPPPCIPLPGRPDRPVLVPPAELKPRSVQTPAGQAVLIHALAHIEFNAINLALDVVWRFAHLPDQFYTDWLHVAAEEAQHFSLLREHLQSLGHDYGDFPAHNGLWEAAEKTASDLCARLALVPRTLEARGLDASPALRAKLAQAGNTAGAAILDLILRDEVGHVATGNRWYHYACQQQQLNPLQHHLSLLQHYGGPKLRPPLNLPARYAAGFTPDEMNSLLAPPNEISPTDG